MALKKNNNQVNGNLIIIRTATRDAEKHDIPATFIAYERVDGKFQEKDTFSQVSGDIKSVEVTTDSYEGNVTHSAKVLMVDAESSETYLLDLRFNILNRTLLNNLMGLTATDNVSISVYNNKKNFASAYIRQGDTPVKWKYEWEQLPKPIDINHPKTGKKIQSDYTEVNEFFVDALTEWAKELNIYKVSNKHTEGTVVTKVAESEPQQVEQVTASNSVGEEEEPW